jgi:hypothetical protein
VFFIELYAVTVRVSPSFQLNVFQFKSETEMVAPSIVIMLDVYPVKPVTANLTVTVFVAAASGVEAAMNVNAITEITNVIAKILVDAILLHPIYSGL